LLGLQDVVAEVWQLLRPDKQHFEMASHDFEELIRLSARGIHEE
jgi:hypothetical protein